MEERNNYDRSNLSGQVRQSNASVAPLPPPGFVADPYQRNVFYQCENFGTVLVIHRFECGSDACYNPTVEVCRHCSRVQGPDLVRMPFCRLSNVC